MRSRSRALSAETPCWSSDRSSSSSEASQNDFSTLAGMSYGRADRQKALCRSAQTTFPAESSSRGAVWRALRPASCESAPLLAVRTDRQSHSRAALALFSPPPVAPAPSSPPLCAAPPPTLSARKRFSFLLKKYLFGNALVFELFFVGRHAGVQTIGFFHDRLQLLVAIPDQTFSSFTPELAAYGDALRSSVSSIASLRANSTPTPLRTSEYRYFQVVLIERRVNSPGMEFPPKLVKGIHLLPRRVDRSQKRTTDETA